MLLIPLLLPSAPAFENFTVGVRDPVVSKPIFRYAYYVDLYPWGPSGPLSHQSRQNVVTMHSLKRGGYRVPGEKKSLNPNEKPP